MLPYCFVRFVLSSQEFIEESVVASQWGDEKKYIVEDRAFEKDHLKGESVLKMWGKHSGDAHGVFHQLQFVVKDGHEKMADKKMEMIIKAHDGQIVNAKPGGDLSVILITRQEKRRKHQEYIDQGHPVLTHEFVFKSILTQELQIASCHLNAQLPTIAVPKGRKTR